MRPDYNRAANMAYKSLISLQVNTLPVDPLAILKRCRNTIIHTYDDIMPRFDVTDRFCFRTFVMQNNDAMTIRKEINGHTVYELFYDSHANPRRMRFTLAHELGHILLNHKMETSWEEQEADYFAAQLLAPRPVFNVLAVHGFDTSSPELIAITFNLSQAAAAIAARTPIHQPDNQLYRDVADQFAEFAAYATGKSAS